MGPNMWELVLPEALERHAPLVGSEGDSLPPHQVGVGQGQQSLDKRKLTNFLLKTLSRPIYSICITRNTIMAQVYL
jgi:hypothetical protein